MRAVSSREYAEMVEDTITEGIEDSVRRAFDFIAREYGFLPDYYEREKVAFEICDELWACGAMAGFRDAVIVQFEKHGMDVASDGTSF